MLSMSDRIMTDITESTINCTENTITHYSLSCEFILMCVNTRFFCTMKALKSINFKSNWNSGEKRDKQHGFRNLC